MAASALTFDRFSESLFLSKLFDNPRPEAQDYRVLAARRDGRDLGFMQSVVNRERNKAWLGLFVVAPAERRQGVATALFAAVRRHWLDHGATEAEVLAIPGNYFHPGVDPRYTPALCFVERMGFERFKDCANLTARLGQRYDTSADEKEVAKQDVVIRRAQADDSGRLDAFFAKDFGPDWRLEAELAMNNAPPALHLAIQGEPGRPRPGEGEPGRPRPGTTDGEIIAFSAHSTQNKEWGFFGPMGTTPPCRGLGIGRILLLRCLNDLRDAGHETAVIPWVGPIGFYSRYCDCALERVFWRYRIALAP